MTCVKLMRPIGVGGVALAYCCGALWLSCKSAGGGADAEAPDTGAAEAGGKGTSGSGSGAATGSGSAGTSIRDAGHAHDDACPTLSGQLSYSFGLANPIVAASSGMFPCNSEAELAAQYYACLYIEISRPSVGEQAVFVTGVQFPKASASGVTVGISGLVDADGPFLFSNFNFYTTNGKSFWPDGPYEMRAYFDQPGNCVGGPFNAWAGTSYPVDAGFQCSTCPDNTQTILFGLHPTEISVTDAAASFDDPPYCRTSGTFAINSSQHLAVPGWDELCVVK
jgi:hypothetical protein